MCWNFFVSWSVTRNWSSRFVLLRVAMTRENEGSSARRWPGPTRATQHDGQLAGATVKVVAGIRLRRKFQRDGQPVKLPRLATPIAPCWRVAFKPNLLIPMRLTITLARTRSWRASAK